jgi:hypothetical protein
MSTNHKIIVFLVGVVALSGVLLAVTRLSKNAAPKTKSPHANRAPPKPTKNSPRVHGADKPHTTASKAPDKRSARSAQRRGLNADGARSDGLKNQLSKTNVAAGDARFGGAGLINGTAHKMAQTALIESRYETALHYALYAYHRKPTVHIVLVIGSAACKIRQPQLALWAYRKLTGGRKRLVGKVCADRGVKLKRAIKATLDASQLLGARGAAATKSRIGNVAPLSLAWAALLSAQYVKALHYARQAYRKNHSSSAVLMLAQAACQTNKPKTALWALKKLSSRRKRLVKFTCSARGIELPGKVKKYGTLRVNTKPWTKIYVDGAYKGVTPKTNLRLPAGRHRLRLVNHSHNISKTYSINIKPGRATVFVRKYQIR